MQPHPGPASVFLHDFDAGGFQRGADGRQGAALGSALSGLEIYQGAAGYDFLTFATGAVVALPLTARAEAGHDPDDLFPSGHDPRFDPHPDLALLLACEAFMEANAEIQRRNGTEEEDFVELAAVDERWRAALEEISDARPVTWHGVRAKAQAAIAAFALEVPVGVGETMEDRAQPHEYVTWQLLHDVLAMGV